jgi:hypothetical protein
VNLFNLATGLRPPGRWPAAAPWALATLKRFNVVLDGWLNAGVRLTRTFTPEQYAKALESWAWLDLAGKKPVFTSAFGDIFFSAADGF